MDSSLCRREQKMILIKDTEENRTEDQTASPSSLHPQINTPFFSLALDPFSFPLFPKAPFFLAAKVSPPSRASSAPAFHIRVISTETKKTSLSQTPPTSASLCFSTGLLGCPHLSTGPPPHFLAVWLRPLCLPSLHEPPYTFFDLHTPFLIPFPLPSLSPMAANHLHSPLLTFAGPYSRALASSWPHRACVLSSDFFARLTWTPLTCLPAHSLP